MSRLEVYDLEHNYVTTLANAYNVGYSKEENQLWDASFQLPYDDPQLKYCRPLRFIKIYDNEDEYIGEFRIWPSEKKKSMSDRQVKIELLDCLHTLTDSVLFGYYQLNNYKTDYVFNWLLNKQKNKRWIPGRVDFQRGFSYAWENENGLVDALFSIPKPFDEDWIMERDTTVYPWKISLVKPQTEVTARIIEGYNLKEFTVKESPQKLVNRVYALGDGEGVNQLTFKTINNGKAYVEDTFSQEEYGLIEYIWTDRRFKDKASQKASTEGMLRNWKKLQYTWEITALDLMKLANRPSNLAINQGREIKANELRLGKVIELITEDNEPIQFRILKESKSDIDDGKANIQLTLGNVIGNTGTTIADVERQQEINTNYANGATNIVPYIFDREADFSNPVEFKFFVDDDVRNVNTCELTVDTSHFRATSKGNTSSPQTVSSSTSSAGGASVQSATSSAGGASVQSATSSAGGSSTQTSSANGSHRHRMFSPGDLIGPLPETRYVAYGGGFVATGSPNDIYTAEAADNHTHTVNIPAHTHNVSINIPAHTHSVSINIPAHTHQVSITIPGHTHEIIYGIFEYANLPSKLKIEVDGNIVPIDSTSFERFDVVPYLSKDEDGKATRGRHTIKITPSDLARIEVQLILRVFIQSQLGGEF
ncbi:MAG: phage tail spike protein [Enterococcus italicus]|uniref:phage tail spike protein n=1 Tax=Enterococcus italicus TaxID=246144 RepID=UPI0039955A46